MTQRSQFLYCTKHHQNHIILTQNLALLLKTNHFLWNSNCYSILLATRETAFIHAISSAAITHEITFQCRQGKIPGCTCAIVKKQRRVTTDDWQWGGCSDDVRFGERETRRFIDRLENGNDARTAFNLHNNEVGRKVR